MKETQEKWKRKKSQDIRKKEMRKEENSQNNRKEQGITLIALVVTIIVPYDKMMKCCNIKSFLSFDYRLRWVKSLSFFTS